MNNNIGFYITQEDNDSENIERILRHSSKREEEPVCLVELADSSPQPRAPEFPLRQRRTTIVNIAGTAPTSNDEQIDPFEWYFRKNSPNIKSPVFREGTVDDLAARRKSRIGGTSMEKMVLTLSNQNLNKQVWPAYIENAKVQRNNIDSIEPRCKSGETQQNVPINMPRGKSVGILTEDIETGEEYLPVIDTIINSLKGVNKEPTVMPAEFSFTESNSPFKRDRDEVKRRPSSRVRVLIMLDEWDGYDRDEEDQGKKRHAKGDGRKGRSDRYASSDESLSRMGNEDSKDKYWKNKRLEDDKRGDRSKQGIKPGYRDDDWKERDFGKSDPKDKRGGRERRAGEEDEYDKYGDRSKRGKKPGYRDDDWQERDFGKSDPKDKRGGRERRAGEEDDYDKYNDRSKRGRKPGYRDDDWQERDFGKSDPKDRRGGREKRAGEEDDYDKYGDRSQRGRKPGYGDDDWSDRDGSKRGRRAGDSDRDPRTYREGTKPGDTSIRGYDSRDPSTYSASKGERADRDRRDKGKPVKSGGDHEDPIRYRTVIIPQGATTLTTRRRYHLQVMDHNMKEPWFNSCFNISKENNVDFNYEGPVKITPYYVGDKFT